MRGPGEYRDTPGSPEIMELLDEDLIRELNDKDEESWEADSSRPGPWGVRAVSLLLALLMVFLVVGRLLTALTLPSLDFLMESHRLSRLPETRELLQAVVQVQADGRQGTGFNIHPKGIIVTNHHVIRGSQTISIRFSGARSLKGRVLEVFPQMDIALVSLDGETLPVLTMDPDYQVEVGEQVLIIGNPLGLSYIVNKGTVVGFAELTGWDEPVLMIRGPVYRGSSGSPVFNEEGRVVAVLFATLSPDDSHENGIIGLAVPLSSINLRLSQGEP